MLTFIKRRLFRTDAERIEETYQRLTSRSLYLKRKLARLEERQDGETRRASESSIAWQKLEIEGLAQEVAMTNRLVGKFPCKQSIAKLESKLWGELKHLDFEDVPSFSRIEMNLRQFRALTLQQASEAAKRIDCLLSE